MVSLLVTLILIVLICWLIFSYVIPKLPDPINTIATVIVAIVIIVWLLDILIAGGSISTGLHILH